MAYENEEANPTTAYDSLLGAAVNNQEYDAFDRTWNKQSDSDAINERRHLHSTDFRSVSGSNIDVSQSSFTNRSTRVNVNRGLLDELHAEEDLDAITRSGFASVNDKRFYRGGHPILTPSHLVLDAGHSPWWTPRGAATMIRTNMKAGSVGGSVLNMIIVTVGGGMLSLPYAVREFGLIGSLSLLVMAGYLSYFTNDLLLIVVDELNEQRKVKGLPVMGKPTYLLLSKECSPLDYGPRFSRFTQLVILVQIFGTYVSYCVGMAGLLDLVWQVSGLKDVTHIRNVYPWVVIIVSWVIIFPLSLMRSMQSLRFSSLLGCLCCCWLSLMLFSEYFVLCKNVGTCFWNQNQHSNHGLLKYSTYIGFSNLSEFVEKVLIALPLCIFSFSNQQYSLPIYVELSQSNRSNMQSVVRNAHSSILLLYFFCAVFGFLSFESDTCSNILLNDFHQRMDAILAAVSMATSMTMTNPIAIYAWRMNYSELFYQGKKQLPLKKHVIVTAVFVFLSMAVSLLVTDIALIFGLLGSTIYPFICFIMPAVYFLILVPNHKYPWIRRFAVIQAITVALLSFLSLCFQLYQLTGHDRNIGDCHNVQTISTSSLF